MIRAQRENLHAVRAVPLLLWAALLVALLGACPLTAHARFDEVANSFPAAQELGSFDDPIYGSDLPDGNYKVQARTTSSMCIFYTNPADAEARDSKEQAILMVNGGRMTAVFYISRAYNYLYLGTQEEAAALTNADGTDASNYIAGDPNEGYVPHLFTMDVSALNVPITFASYSGGNNGNENGVWYTREAVFGMSREEFVQIKRDAQGSEDDGGDGGQPDSEPSGSDQPAPDDEPEGPSVPEESDGSAQNEDSQEDNRAPQVALDTDNINTSGDDSGGGGNAEQVSENTSEDRANADDATPVSASAIGQRGIRMLAVDGELTLDLDIDEGEDEQEEVERGLAPSQILMLVIIGLFVAGIASRILVFRAGFDRGNAAVGSLRPTTRGPSAT